MKITLVCNCGLLIENEIESILVDAPTENSPPYFAFPDTEKIIARIAPYDKLKAVLFTHLHPDHYCADAVSRIFEARPELQIVKPKEQTIKIGSFSIEFHSLSHTPMPNPPEHFVIYISDTIHSVYISADAACDADAHRRILDGRKVDAAFWNGMYLSHENTRDLIRDCTKRSYIYHIPIDENDVSGIRRKCDRNMQRFGDTLPNVQLLKVYPTEIIL